MIDQSNRAVFSPHAGPSGAYSPDGSMVLVVRDDRWTAEFRGGTEMILEPSLEKRNSKISPQKRKMDGLKRIRENTDLKTATISVSIVAGV
ncbi:UNVERIFIED_CONTAM: hypothetical protein PYX00_007000 [Menopon gallinae]|uniref:Uncharacterized protein n=1 Tax=Menopon gallinae TaxID=328185 RepID=A0AAW2HHP4_9NEOP